MKALAIVAIAYGATQIPSYSITIEPDDHHTTNGGCLTTADFGAASDDLYTDYYCVVRQKLPYDSVGCLFKAVKIVRKDAA